MENVRDRLSVVRLNWLRFKKRLQEPVNVHAIGGTSPANNDTDDLLACSHGDLWCWQSQMLPQPLPVGVWAGRFSLFELREGGRGQPGEAQDDRD